MYNNIWMFNVSVFLSQFYSPSCWLLYHISVLLSQLSWFCGTAWLLEDIVMLITLGYILKLVSKHHESLCVFIVVLMLQYFFLWRMTPTKSSRPRQIEEESNVRAPNFPIGPDHEDDITNQGSGDARVSNLPIGPDHEDEDSDNGSHSPSAYLNLNQDENEEDARNAEDVGDENEEDEGSAEQALVGALSASQVRCGHGLNKLPSGCFVITAVNEARNPTQPPILINAWKTPVGKFVRENVVVTYRFWKGKKHEEKYIVLDSIK
jgi:hypothetical protein